MPRYTFKYMDAQLAPLAAFSPKIMFYLDKEATVAGGWLISDKPVEGVLLPDGSGYVDLVSNDQIQGQSHYIVRGEFLNSSGSPTSIDLWRFYARVSGGVITDMLDPTWSPAQVISSITEPDPWPVGWIWFNPSTDDLYRRVS